MGELRPLEDFEDEVYEDGGWGEWVDCWQCGGDGEFDLYEEDPTAHVPGEVEPCEECHGRGGWYALLEEQ